MKICDNLTTTTTTTTIIIIIIIINLNSVTRNNMNIGSRTKVYNIITKERVSVGRVRNRENLRQDPLSTKNKNVRCTLSSLFFLKERRK
jgi:hypothetical protein